MTMAKNRFKILIVEDEANIRTFIRAMLEAEDYQVLCAPDCAAGISMFSSHCPDLVILEIYSDCFFATPAIPMPYTGMPEDAAWAMVYLCSDEAKYINGVCLPIDGGWYVRH